MDPETLGPPGERQHIHLELRQPHYVDDLKAVAKLHLSGTALPQLHHIWHDRDRR